MIFMSLTIFVHTNTIFCRKVGQNIGHLASYLYNLCIVNL
jgi:hypothetical protein